MELKKVMVIGAGQMGSGISFRFSPAPGLAFPALRYQARAASPFPGIST